MKLTYLDEMKLTKFILSFEVSFEKGLTWSKYCTIKMCRSVIAYLNESNAQLGDGDGGHEDGQEEDDVIKEAGSEV